MQTLHGVGLLITALASVSVCLSAAERPNIVFILADDLGYGDLGCYGRKDIQTPVLDQLAAEGVKLTQHYANGPECTPTRAAFLTGRYPQWIGGLECAIGTGNVGRYDDAIRLRTTHALGLPTTEKTIAQHLREVGYATALSGKWHLGYESEFQPNRHGFDHSFYCIGGGMDYFHYLDTVAGYNLFRGGRPVSGKGYFTDLMTDDAIDFVRRNSDQPFFLYLAYTCPHSPFQGPNDLEADPLPLDSPLWRQGSAPPDVYVAMIEHMDTSIGRFLHMLDEQDLREETLVVFAGDNGGTGSARNAPLSGTKGGTYEGGIRVPAIINWPGHIPAGIESDQLSITFDFTASIASLAGCPIPRERPLEGIDIVQHLEQQKPNVDRDLYWRKPRGDTVWHGLRSGNLKFVARDKGNQYEEYLFDLSQDIGEKNDLKKERAKDLEKLRSRYRDWEKRTRLHRRGRPGWTEDRP